MIRVTWKPSDNVRAPDFQKKGGTVGVVQSRQQPAKRAVAQSAQTVSPPKPFEEKHTKAADGSCRWGCTYTPTTDTVTNAKAASDYYDCLSKNSPTDYPLSGKPAYIVKLLVGTGEQITGNETCPDNGGSTTTNWVPWAIGGGIVATGIAVALAVALTRKK